MNSWRFIPLEVRDGHWNMALDEAVLKACIEKKSPNTVRLFKWDPSSVTIGRNQSLSAEVDLHIAKEKGFNIVRRITGGGAVFHDSVGEITYSVICPLKHLDDKGYRDTMEQFEIITQGIVEAVNRYRSGSDKGVVHCPALFLDGKKFSGNARTTRGGFLLQHGTILLEIRPELMYSVLKAPHNVPIKKMVASVYAKVIGIKEIINNYEEEIFLEHLFNGFESALGMKMEKGNFSQYEIKLAEDLIKKRYRNDDWLHKYE